MKSQYNDSNQQVLKQETMSGFKGNNRSFVLEAVQHVTIRDIPVPEIEDPYDVIVQIKQTGICGYAQHTSTTQHLDSQKQH
jgi:D-xylulose reductase